MKDVQSALVDSQQILDAPSRDLPSEPSEPAVAAFWR
jgi:hypothetical protein